MRWLFVPLIASLIAIGLLAAEELVDGRCSGAALGPVGFPQRRCISRSSLGPCLWNGLQHQLVHRLVEPKDRRNQRILLIIVVY